MYSCVIVSVTLANEFDPFPCVCKSTWIVSRSSLCPRVLTTGRANNATDRTSTSVCPSFFAMPDHRIGCLLCCTAMVTNVLLNACWITLTDWQQYAEVSSAFCLAGQGHQRKHTTTRCSDYCVHEALLVTSSVRTIVLAFGHLYSGP